MSYRLSRGVGYFVINNQEYPKDLFMPDYEGKDKVGLKSADSKRMIFLPAIHYSQWQKNSNGAPYLSMEDLKKDIVKSIFRN